MKEQTYIIQFEGYSPADANRYAEELRNALLSAAPDAKVERRREDPDAQDFGATLVLILGTPVAVVLANAFRDWINRRSEARVHIKTPKGEILLEGITTKTAHKVLELFKSAQ
jgi:hypothetical protein